MKAKYINFRAKNPVTGCNMGNLCPALCSKPLAECPLYNALTAEKEITVTATKNQYGADVVDIVFPLSYNSDLITKKCELFTNIAVKCVTKSR